MDIISSISGTHIYKVSTFNSSGLLFCSILFFSVLIFGCDNSTDPDPLSGSVVGLVQPVNQWNNPIQDSSAYADVDVKLEGTSYSTTTDSSGRYVLDDIDASTYTIAVGKSGYGTNKLPFYQFIGGGQDFVNGGSPIEIGEIPGYDISADSAFADYGNIVFQGSISATIPEGGLATIVTYVSDSSNISPTDPSSYLAVNANTSFPGVSKFAGVFNVSNFSAGQELYFKSYPIAKSSLFYLDPSAETNRVIYSSLGEPTDEVSFIVPENANAKGNGNMPNSSLKISFNTPNNTKSKTFSIPENATSEDLIEIKERIDTYTSQMEEQWSQ